MPLVADPDEPLADLAYGPEHLVGLEAGILDADDLLHLGQPRHEIGRPPLGVVRQQRQPRSLPHQAVVLEDPFDIDGHQIAHERRHPQHHARAHFLVTWRQFQGHAQITG